jgi:enterochelin esterase-like enzyme
MGKGVRALWSHLSNDRFRTRAKATDCIDVSATRRALDREASWCANGQARRARVQKSVLLESERKIWVYTPRNYDAKTPGGYRLLVLFDGISYQNWIPAPTILDHLIHAGKFTP